MIRFLNRCQDIIDRVRFLDFFAPLLLRLYLAPIFWMAGTTKLGARADTIDWFGNAEWGLGLPYPTIMYWSATLAEAGGAILLLLGFAVRWISVPLMVTMVVAMVAVHWDNGWLAIATGEGIFATERTVEAIERLDRARSILQEHGNYQWLTEKGNFVVLNNGIEYAATYFIMLLVLFFTGAGRYLSLDYWIARKFRQP